MSKQTFKAGNVVEVKGHVGAVILESIDNSWVPISEPDTEWYCSTVDYELGKVKTNNAEVTHIRDMTLLAETLEDYLKSIDSGINQF